MTRRLILVVSDRKDLPSFEGAVVTADEFLAGNVRGTTDPRKTVVNLCRDTGRYMSRGYYVSLIADARGQTVLPSVDTFEGMSNPYSLFRALQEGNVPTVDLVEMGGRRRALPPAIVPTDPAPAGRKKPSSPSPLVRQWAGESVVYRPALESELAECLVFFGMAPDPRFRRIAAGVYRIWPVPILRLRLIFEEEEWKVFQAAPVSVSRLTAAQRPAFLEEIRSGRARELQEPRETICSIAVLFDPNDPFSPSTPETIDKLERTGARMNVHVRRIGPGELGRLGHYDALFIRTLTGIQLPAFRFATRAEALGMPVIDDTQSIIRCSNKVFLYELLRREGIPTPPTLVVAPQTTFEQLEERLGLPVILKLPDGSFSTAVRKVASRGEFRRQVEGMMSSSPLLIAQGYRPTGFDWRVTTLGGRVLFVCKYHMARGHWQIQSNEPGRTRYGKVEGIAREYAPSEITALACRVSRLIGDGLYGVDLKESPDGPVVIEINDNPNLEIGYEDSEEGDVIYEEILSHFIGKVKKQHEPAPPKKEKRKVDPNLAPLRKPIGRAAAEGRRRAYKAFEVCGVELEYAVTDRDLNPASLVAPAFSLLAGRPVSDLSMGAVGYSNEIMDHVFEIKTEVPQRSLVKSEQYLVEGIRRFATVLRERFGGRLLPTGMHPWMNPKKGRIWKRSHGKIYQTYSRLFDVATHGWTNVHALHVNLPFGRDEEAAAMMNASALLLPYVPAIAASTPMFEGELQPSVDNRLAFILEHQLRIPESCGDIIPEYTRGLRQYKREILRPMYRALDRYPDAKAIRGEFFNARGAVFKYSRESMEVRVIDMQECVKMDMAIAAFVRGALKTLSKRILSGKIELPDHGTLVSDFREAVRKGTAASVAAPHLCRGAKRDSDGKLPIRTVLRELLELARKGMRKEEEPYALLIGQVIRKGNLSERIAAALSPIEEDEAFTEAARRIYIELSESLLENEPWPGRGIS